LVPRPHADVDDRGVFVGPDLALNGRSVIRVKTLSERSEDEAVRQILADFVRRQVGNGVVLIERLYCHVEMANCRVEGAGYSLEIAVTGSEAAILNVSSSLSQV
ncbi:MAG: hypothetical protein ABR537_06920, partial [Gemmatimonadales bacterium]